MKAKKDTELRKIKKIVTSADEREFEPKQRLKKIQLYTYWLVEAIQSRILEPTSSRYFIFFEGDRRSAPLFEINYFPDSTNKFENKRNYYHLAHQIQMLLLTFDLSNQDATCDLSVDIKQKITVLLKESIKLELMFDRICLRKTKIFNSEFHRVVKFKKKIDSLGIP